MRWTRFFRRLRTAARRLILYICDKTQYLTGNDHNIEEFDRECYVEPRGAVWQPPSLRTHCAAARGGADVDPAGQRLGVVRGVAVVSPIGALHIC